MTDPMPPLALRDIRRAARAHLGAPRTLAGMAAVAALLGVSGPFDTADALRLPARLAYWTFIVAGAYAVGTLVALLLTGRAMARPARLGAEVALTAAGASLVVVAATAVAIGATGRGAVGWAILTAEVTGVTALVVLLREVLAVRTGAGGTGNGATREGGPEDERTGSPPLLRRLPVAARGPLVALSATDHYVEVRTTAGRALVLMRLGDAIAEAAPTPGLRVHRSHWVAVGRVADAARRGDGARLRMETGEDIPVARSHMDAVRAAGLLPARPGPGKGDARE